MLAVVAIAQQTTTEDQQQTGQTKKGKNEQATEQTQSSGAGAATQGKSGKQERRAAKAARRENATGQENAGGNVNANANAQNGADMNKQGGKKGRRGVKAKAEGNADTVNATSQDASANAGANTAGGTNVDTTGKGKGKGKHGRNARNEAASPNAGAASATASVTPSASVAGGVGAQTTTTNANGTANQTNVDANAGANASANVAAGGRIRGHGKGGKQLDQNVVQRVKTQHTSFKAQPRPDKVPKVTFTEGRRIEHADQWQGEHYNAFRSYHSERHDRNWWHSHYPRVEIIGGGAYYWNSGYWYPAWGYDPGNEYYAYDGPIYAGQQVRPPDQVIADVQALLQEAGYYTGEVDGLLGPLTRQALTDYQADNGLYTTAAIDEPTLESLGLS